MSGWTGKRGERMMISGKIDDIRNLLGQLECEFRNMNASLAEYERADYSYQTEVKDLELKTEQLRWQNGLLQLMVDKLLPYAPLTSLNGLIEL